MASSKNRWHLKGWLVRARPVLELRRLRERHPEPTSEEIGNVTSTSKAHVAEAWKQGSDGVARKDPGDAWAS